MLSLDLWDIAGRVTGPVEGNGTYLTNQQLPGAFGQTVVVAVPVSRGSDIPDGMLRSRTVLLSEDGRIWLKYSANVNQPERIESIGSMLRSLASWKAAEELQEVVGRVNVQ